MAAPTDRLFFEDLRDGAGPTVFTPYRLTDADLAVSNRLAGHREPFVSGWHLGRLQMRLLCENLLLRSSSVGSPGIDRLVWHRRVGPGTELTVRPTVLGATAPRSRPDRGFVQVRLTMSDEAGDPVMVQDCAVMFGRREPGPAAPESRPAAPPPAVPEGDTGEEPIGRHRFTADEIVAFAQDYDPQPFHLDAALAAQSHFGRLAASGWHTVTAWARLVGHEPPVDPAAPPTRLTWNRPVFADDVIRFARLPGQEGPGQAGETLYRGRNAAGETVFTVAVPAG